MREKIVKSAEECSEYLKKVGKVNILCLIYGGNTRAKSLFKCLIHNYEWETTLDTVKRKVHGCPKCGKVARIKDIDEVNDWLKVHNTNIECCYYARTTNSNNSKFKCLIDGYEWKTTFNDIKCGRRCPKCSGHTKIQDIGEVNDWLKNNHKKIKCIDYCGNVINKSLFECLVCGKKWDSTFNNIKNGRGCPYCHVSCGEKSIANILDKYNIEYIPEYRFENCKSIRPLPFDFALIKENNIIGLCEYQGKQHYEPVDFANKGEEWATELFAQRIEYDMLKRDFCKNNNIPLLEVPYWEYENIETIILDFVRGVTDYEFCVPLTMQIT